MGEQAKLDIKGKEKEIVREVLQAFEETTGREAICVTTGRTGQKGHDAEIRLDGEGPLAVAVKLTLTPATLGNAAAQIARFNRPALLVTRYVTPQLAARLKDMKVQFLDTAGNAFIQNRKMLIYITGQKPKGATRPERTIRAFRAPGLRVIFALLCLPDLVKAPYRQIATHADVALATVGWTLKDLQLLGYFRPTKRRGGVLQKRDQLVDAWAEAYPQQLRPRLKPRRYNVADFDWWRKEDFDRLDMQLGGEPAAALLTRNLRPEIVTVYGDKQFPVLARKIHPVKDNQGNLEVLERFWNFAPPPVNHYQVVPPLLVYADLLGTGDARNLEAAEAIRERFLV